MTLTHKPAVDDGVERTGNDEPSTAPWRWLLRYGVTPYLIGTDALSLLVPLVLFHESWARTVLIVTLCIGLVASAGLYRPRLMLSALDDGIAVAARVVIAFALVGAAIASVRGGGMSATELQVLAVAVVTVSIGRAIAYSVVRAARRRRIIAHPTLVVGAGFTGLELSELLLEHPEYGLEPVGYFDPDPVPGLVRPIPVLEESESAAAAIIATRAEVVIVAFGSTPERRLVDVLRDCDRMRAEIFLIPRLYELIDTTGRDGDSIWGTPVIRLPRSSHRSRSWICKRVFDLILSVLAAIILLPVIALAALATRLDLGPGVLFRQERVGLDGRSFEILKFRTVGIAADHDPETAWDADPGHVSRIGHTMRRLSLDELPQLWNVMRGDMSLVGPRPERPHFVGKFSAEFPSYRHRHRVPCGMTGLAQVNGLRGDTSIERRARFDNAYIEGWSVSNDVKILLKTVSSVVRREGS